MWGCDHFRVPTGPYPTARCGIPIFGDGSEKGKINLKSTTVHLYNIVTQLSILYLYIVLSDNQEIPRIYAIFEWFLSRSQISRKGDFFCWKMGEVLLGVPAFHTILRFILLGRFKTTLQWHGIWDLPQHHIHRLSQMLVISQFLPNLVYWNPLLLGDSKRVTIKFSLPAVPYHWVFVDPTILVA